MSIGWKISDDNLVTFTVSGQLGKAEYEKIQEEMESVIQKVGQIKVLVLLKDFNGWEKAEGWEDTSFVERNDPYIKKLRLLVTKNGVVLLLFLY